jgi:hypothetical protein
MDIADAVTGWVRPRVRIVGSASAIGFLLSVLAVVVLPILPQYDLRFVSTQTFLLAVLCFGFGVLGWSGSILAGNGLENAQRHLDTRTNWSEADSRRAMARIGGFGVGGMVGVIIATTLLR